jgi:hypothetical protein
MTAGAAGAEQLDAGSRQSVSELSKSELVADTD